MSIEKLIKKMWIYTQWNISHKKNEILSFVAIWIDLEGIMISETSQRQIPYDISYTVESKK